MPVSPLHPQLQRERQRWSIAVLRLSGRLDLGHLVVPSTANLTATDVTDINAAFVADPFLVFRDARWHMFMEVMCRRQISGARRSRIDIRNWCSTSCCPRRAAGFPIIRSSSVVEPR